MTSLVYVRRLSHPQQQQNVQYAPAPAMQATYPAQQQGFVALQPAPGAPIQQVQHAAFERIQTCGRGYCVQPVDDRQKDSAGEAISGEYAPYACPISLESAFPFRFLAHRCAQPPLNTGFHGFG